MPRSIRPISGWLPSRPIASSSPAMYSAATDSPKFSRLKRYALAMSTDASSRTGILANLAALDDRIGDDLAVRAGIDRAGAALVDFRLQPAPLGRALLVLPQQIADIVARARITPFGHAAFGPI